MNLWPVEHFFLHFLTGFAVQNPYFSNFTVRIFNQSNLLALFIEKILLNTYEILLKMLTMKSMYW